MQNNILKTFYDTKAHIDQNILHFNRLEKVMKRFHKDNLIGDYNFSSVSFKDEKGNILHIEYRLSKIEFMRPASKNNSMFINGWDCYSQNETMDMFVFSKETQEELFLAILYISQGIWGDKFSLPLLWDRETKWGYTTSEFEKYSQINTKPNGQLRIHLEGFAAKGPHPQTISTYHHKGSYSGRRWECAVLFAFRRPTLERFLIAVQYIWFGSLSSKTS